MPTLSSMTGGPIHTVAPDDDGDGAELDRHRAHPGRARTDRLPHGARWRDHERAALDGRRAGGAPFAPAPRRAAVRTVPRTIPCRSSARPNCRVRRFSEAHLRGSKPTGGGAVVDRRARPPTQLAAGERFVYCYYGGVDKIAHERGFGPYYDAELRFADQIVADILAALRPDTALLVTADHGQVDVGRSHRVVRQPRCWRVSPFQSGEGRFRWLHAQPGAIARSSRRPTEEIGHVGVGRHTEQMLDEHWFGPSMAPAIRPGSATSRSSPSDRQLPRSGRFRTVRARVSSRIAHVGRGQRAVARPLCAETGRTWPCPTSRHHRNRASRPDHQRRRRTTDRRRRGDRRGARSPRESVTEPAKVMRIGSMVKQLLDEVRAAPLDEAVRERLAEIYERSITELSMALSPDLQEELHIAGAAVRPGRRAERERAAHRQGPARRLARGAVPRHPGDADGPTVRRPPATRTDARTPEGQRLAVPPIGPGGDRPGTYL